jgi:Zn-finger nucleic acid-binding protein
MQDFTPSKVISNPNLVECTGCNNNFNSHFRFCPFCGEAAPQVSSWKDLLCPHCKCVMNKVMEIESIIDVCPECDGVWCEDDELEELTRERDVYNMDDIPRKFTRKQLPQALRYIPCPECEKVMQRINFAGITNIIVDICHRHGIWLDSGELEEIRTFIANGGIDKAQNQQLRNMKIDLEGVAQDAKQAKLVIRTLNKFSLKRIALAKF